MAAEAQAIDQINLNATRAFAYAFLASHADVFVAAAYRFWETSRALDQLLAILTPHNVELLGAAKSDAAVKVKTRLEELHHLIATFSRSESADKVKRVPVFKSYIERIQNNTEELGEIIDTLALASNSDFLSLVSRCASNLELEGSEDPIGRMHR